MNWMKKLFSKPSTRDTVAAPSTPAAAAGTSSGNAATSTVRSVADIDAGLRQILERQKQMEAVFKERGQTELADQLRGQIEQQEAVQRLGYREALRQERLKAQAEGRYRPIFDRNE